MLTFEDLFRSYRRSVIHHARCYLQGLLNPTIRKNVEDIAEAVPEGNTQDLQQFISSSKWSADAVMDRVARNTGALIGDPIDAALLIDESGFPKKGKHSVGVARQWLGCMGKTDNGQVGVYAALCHGSRASLINTRLYLSKEWIDDPDRCRDKGVPEERIRLLTKEELGIEMVDDALRQELKFGWVGADAGYGKSLWFMLEVERRGLQFSVDVHKDMRIYLEKVHPYVPSKKGTRGRQPTDYVVDQKALRVDTWTKQQPRSEWKTLTVRDSTKGPLRYELCARRVSVWSTELKGESREWWLVVRRNADTHDDYKYTLINAPDETPLKRLAYMQGQRYWIEHAIEVAKGECGMADYEVRFWNGWHHHMALVMMAQLFLLSEGVDHADDYPLLSPQDVMLLLAIYLPQRELTVKEIIIEMRKRHYQRERTKESAVRKHNAKIKQKRRSDQDSKIT